jgi:hypothetical protein
MKKRNAHWIFFGNPIGRKGGREGDRLGGLGTDGGIILKWI